MKIFAPLFQGVSTPVRPQAPDSFQPAATPSPVFFGTGSDTLTIRFAGKKLTEEEKALRAFKRRAEEITDLGVIANEYSLQGELLAGRPENSILEERSGRRAGRIANLISRKFRSKKMGQLLQYLNQPEVKAKLNRRDQAMVESWLEDYQDEVRLPADFSKRSAETYAAAHPAWRSAREGNNYAGFVPHLSKIVSLQREMANLLNPGGDKTPYDVLLDKYEEGFTSDVLDPLFAKLRDEISPLIQAIQASPQSKKTFDFLDREVTADEMNRVLGFDNTATLKERQARNPEDIPLMERIVLDMGLDPSRLRVGRSAHPFMNGQDSPFDVFFAVRPTPNKGKIRDVIEQLGSGLHEAGHAIFEQKADESLAGTGLTGGTLGIHESQSRLWENKVGRSKAFWKHYYPMLQKALPQQLGDVSLDEFYQAINTVQPSPIRVEADELTYNQHIMVRYETEKDLINASNPEAVLANLPQAWNERMAHYVGYQPKNDSEGVLQDVHWSAGLVGYFPSYTLGNLGASQFYHAAEKAIGKEKLDEAIGRGELTVLSNWLAENIYKDGSIETYQDILKRVTGEPLNAEHYVRDMKEKYGALYGLDLEDQAAAARP